MAVCEKTWGIMTDPSGPYAGEMIGVAPRIEVPDSEAQPFACRTTARRHPRVTKGEDYRETVEATGEACGPEGCC